jgi:hypothetical protein
VLGGTERHPVSPLGSFLRLWFVLAFELFLTGLIDVRPVALWG